MNIKEALSMQAHVLATSSVMLGVIWIFLIELLSPPDRFGISSAWFLLCPAFCILFALLSLIGTRKSGSSKGHRWAIAGIILNILLLVGGTYTIYSQRLFKETIRKGGCAFQLEKLGSAMSIYSTGNEVAYPVSYKWCDSLLLVSKRPTLDFVCESSNVPFNYIWLKPNEEAPFEEEMILVQEQENGVRIYATKISTYAMNPNCELNSPADTVLLFETKGGWNQNGGPELLTFDNHKGKGSNILFNNGDVKFIKPNEVSKLKWKAEPRPYP